MAIIRFNFLSKTLGMQTSVNICLPTQTFAEIAEDKDIYVPGMKYQVMWLLHGYSGDQDDYLSWTNIARYSDEHKIAVVMPSGYNSSYEDYEEGEDAEDDGGHDRPG